jgi:hypothetical protein
MGYCMPGSLIVLEPILVRMRDPRLTFYHQPAICYLLCRVTPGNAGLCINTTCPASSKSNVGAVVGGVAGGILVIVIAMILIYCLCWKKKAPWNGKPSHGGTQILAATKNSFLICSCGG